VHAALVLLAAAVITSYAYITNPQRAAALATGLIETIMPVRVDIDRARFGLDGTIELENVEMYVDDMPSSGAKVLAAERIIIEHDTLSLIRRRFKPTRMVVKRPELYVTEDSGTGRVNLQYLFGDDSSEGMPDHLPAIFIEEGFVQRGKVGSDGYRRVTRVESLAGSLLETSAGSGTYAFIMRQTPVDGGLGPMLSGQINLRQFKASARLEDFPFDSPLLDLLPARLREMWRRFDPSGSLPAVTFDYRGADVPVSAALDLHDSAISLPVTEPPIRLSGVAGRIRLDTGRVVPDLTCRIRHQAPRILADCGIEGWMGPITDGLDAEVPFRLAIQARGNIPPQKPLALSREDRQGLPATSRVVHWLHQWFEPAGTFVADLVVERAERGPAPPRVLGSVQLSGQGRFLLFPYPLEGVSGQLVLTGNGLNVVDLRGNGRGASRLEVSGRVAPLRSFPEVAIEVEGWQLPIDEALFTAIRMKRPDAVSAINMFMDTEVFAALRRRLAGRPPETADGVLPEAVQALLARLEGFEPGGTVAHLHADIRRGLGRGAAVDLTTRLDLEGAAIMFRHWPYPLKATGGSLLITDRQIRADGIEGKGPDPRSRFTLDGTVQRREGGWKNADIDLRVSAHDVLLDALLLNTMPEAQTRLLESMALAGRGSAEAVITRRGDGKIDYVIRARLDSGQVRPFGGRFVVQDLGRRRADPEGWDLTITPNRVTFHQLRGHASTGAGDEASPIELSGSVFWHEGRLGYDIDVTAENLSFDAPILDVLSPRAALFDRLQSLYDRYQPQGTLDGQLHLESNDDGSVAYSLRLEPHWFSVVLRDRRIRMDDISGAVFVAGGRLTLETLQGRFAKDGRFSLEGTVDLAANGHADLVFRMAAGEVEGTLRSLLPQRILQTLEAIQLRGGYRVDEAALQWWPSASVPGVVQHRFVGTVHLQNAQAVLGIPVQHIDGKVKITSTQKVGAAWPVVTLDVNAAQLRVTDRRISPLSMRVASDETYADRLRIADVRGSCYGGKIIGDGWIDLANDGAYNVRMTVSGAQLAPMLRPEVGARQAASATGRSEGTIDALLVVDGRLADPATRRGRGSLAIRDAEMYELPLAMGLLQVASLALPTSESFDHARVEYGIDGDAIRFDQLRLTAPTVEMEGSGTMSYATRQLDLTLAVRRPDDLWDNPVTELLEKVKDELVTVRVTGTLDHPVPRVESLRGIRRSWNSIFGSGSSSQ